MVWPILATAVSSAIGAMLPRLAAAVGVFAVSAIAIKPIVIALENRFLGQLSGLPEDVRSFLAFIGFYDFVSIIFAAILVAIGISAAKTAASVAASKKG